MAVEQRKSAAVIWAFAFAMVLMIGAVAAKGGDGHGTGGRPQIGKSSKSAAVAAAKLMPQDMILGFLGLWEMVGSCGGNYAATATLFRGVRFFLSGFDRAEECQFIDALEQHGSSNAGQYSSSCSHVIVSQHTYDDPICAAARKDGKVLVTKSWVLDSLEQCELKNANSVLYMPVRDLAGIPGAKKVCVCLTGYQSASRREIEAMVAMMGASFTKPLDARKVTHLVCYKFEGDKYELAEHMKLKLVNHRWLEDCLRTWSLVDEANYRISGHDLEIAEAQAKDAQVSEQPNETNAAPPEIAPDPPDVDSEATTQLCEAEDDCVVEGENVTSKFMGSPMDTGNDSATKQRVMDTVNDSAAKLAEQRVMDTGNDRATKSAEHRVMPSNARNESLSGGESESPSLKKRKSFEASSDHKKTGEDSIRKRGRPLSNLSPRPRHSDRTMDGQSPDAVKQSPSKSSNGSGKRIYIEPERSSSHSKSGSAAKKSGKHNAAGMGMDNKKNGSFKSRRLTRSGSKDSITDANGHGTRRKSLSGSAEKLTSKDDAVESRHQPANEPKAQKQTDVINLDDEEEKKDEAAKEAAEVPVKRGRGRPKKSKPIIPETTKDYRFALSGHTEEKRKHRLVIRSLHGHLCRDDHIWKEQTTHCVMGSPLRRTEKLFAALASGRWILKFDYLEACAKARRFVDEEPYEWFEPGDAKDGTIDLRAPRKWRLSKQETGCGAFEGLRVIVYGECILPSLDTLKRAIKAGGGAVVAVEPPYTIPLATGVDFAIVGLGIPENDPRVVEILKRKVACVRDEFFVEFVCNPSASWEKHVLFSTEAAVEKALAKLATIKSYSSRKQSGGEEGDGGGGAAAAVVAEEEMDRACNVCGRKDSEEVMLFCDGDDCEVATHTFCLEPPLDKVPAGDWYCARCSS
ncbi:BRCT domain-containing protein At4g02110 [Selaginella moellendorffii]|uniref:BRCT domain-containing protein At4g02110 n=1 Tax=Selaginella moellendorffii TaxID=88036 RepID=UPI000D1C6856|nr:BRCT domain-containing protein At4g02110 [Selaginella moellendorffii]|eukprot:XP_024527911.1 BRCT domain-containing protein At4g02110 [Selaginella moellendorffii]